VISLRFPSSVLAPVSDDDLARSSAALAAASRADALTSRASAAVFCKSKRRGIFERNLIRALAARSATVDVTRLTAVPVVRGNVEGFRLDGVGHAVITARLGAARGDASSLIEAGLPHTREPQRARQRAHGPDPGRDRHGGLAFGDEHSVGGATPLKTKARGAGLWRELGAAR